MKNFAQRYVYWDTVNADGRRSIPQLRYYGDSSFVLFPLAKAAGSNGWAQLGNGVRTDTSGLVDIKKSSNMIAVAASHGASAGLLRNGKVLSWGSDNNDELGDNDTSSALFRILPDSVKVMLAGVVQPLPKIKSIKGANHGWFWPSALESDGRFIALDSTGKVFVWGKNNLGQTGFPSTVRVPRARNINFGAGLTAQSIEAGGQHGIALLSDGTVGTFGYGFAIGQGQEFRDGQTQARSQGVGQVMRRNLDGNIMSSECPDFDIPSKRLQNIVSVGAGADISFAISADDTVFAWGNNYRGAAGIGTWAAGKYCAWVVGPLCNKHLVAISSGTDHSLGLDAEGKVWAWGDNTWGATGIGGISGWVTQWTGGIVEPRKLSIPGRVIKISAGDFFNAVLDSAGNAYVWGNNNKGQLGLGHTRTVTSPTKLPGKYRDIVAGTGHILAVPSW